MKKDERLSREQEDLARSNVLFGCLFNEYGAISRAYETHAIDAISLGFCLRHRARTTSIELMTTGIFPDLTTKGVSISSRRTLHFVADSFVRSQHLTSNRRDSLRNTVSIAGPDALRAPMWTTVTVPRDWNPPDSREPRYWDLHTVSFESTELQGLVTGQMWIKRGKDLRYEPRI